MARIDNISKQTSPTGNGIWQRFRERWLGGLNLPGLSQHGGENDGDHHVKVWDKRRGCYRYVDLNDRSDPLWSSAYAVAMLQRENEGRRSAA